MIFCYLYLSEEDELLAKYPYDMCVGFYENQLFFANV